MLAGLFLKKPIDGSLENSFLVVFYVSHEVVAFLKNIRLNNINTICFYQNIIIKKTRQLC